MAPPRHHHHHNNSNNHHHSSTNGSPFPPLGLAAANAAISSSPLHSTSAFSSSNDSTNDMIQAGGDNSSGLPPAPQKVDANQAQACRLQDAYWSDEEEDLDCPLCLEEIDLSDANFKPCPCGYQICRFCWHHIKENLNGRCPACRRKYTDTSVEFKAMSQDEIKRLAQAKKQKEREKKELEQMNRKHLANMRVVQKNLVYVVGLDPKLAKEELIPTLRSNEFFGQYGRISKILISKRTTASKLIMGTQESAIGVYVTYVRKEDAARAIIAIDGSKGPDGKTIRASYGTTKYCTTYLRNLPCTNAICTYLHEPGEEADSFTKEDLSTLRHAAKDTEHKSRPTPTPASFSTVAPKSDQPSMLAVTESIESSALPKTASWASGKPGATTAIVSSTGNGPTITTQTQIPGGGGSSSNTSSNGNAIRDQELPPLSALQQSSMTRKGSGHQNRAPASPGARIPTAPKGRVATVGSAAIGSSEIARSESPKLPSNLGTSTTITASPPPSSTPLSTTSSQAPLPPPPPPGLSKQPPKGPSAMLNNTTRNTITKEGTSEEGGAGGEEEKNSAPSTPTPLPPGLSKRGSGISQATASRPATPSLLHDSVATASSTSANASSTYQPSLGAQALLDDMRSRREAESYRPVKSPFPDFDATLSSFKDGDDFCFTFEESQIPTSIKESTAMSAFTPFAMNGHGMNSSYFGGASLTPPPPPGISTPTRSTTASPAPPPGLFGMMNGASTMGYTGRFDPFAPGAGEMITSLEDDTTPLTSNDQKRRTFNEERGENGNGNEEREDEETRLSRFGFSKRRESPFFKTHDDLLGFVKGGAAARMSESDSTLQQQNTQTGGMEDSTNWLSDLQKRAAAAQAMSGGQGSNTYGAGVERGYGGQTYSGNGGNREDPLLAQLLNHRPLEGGLPYHDPAIMSFTRQQQAQAQAQHQQQQQQPHPQDSYGGGFNPFETSQANPNYRSAGNNSFQGQPFGGHRTFA